MIFGAMFKNPLNGPDRPWKPWYGYLAIGILVIGLCLYIYQRANGGPVVPTSSVPSIVYQNAQAAREHALTKPAIPVVPTAPTVDLSVIAKAVLDKIAADQPVVANTPLPASVNLAIPFTSQAPFAIWDSVHKDTCEEASILMVSQYFANVTTTTIEPQAADDALLAMVDAETKAGLSTSLTVAELGKFAESFYPTLKPTVIDNPTIDQIKTYIHDGIPVLVPVAGRQMGNPFYAGLGPLYHYVVIRGYDGTNFITNDPGTRRGENYTYSQSVIMDAMGDWNGGDPVNGEKRILILKLK